MPLPILISIVLFSLYMMQRVSSDDGDLSAQQDTPATQSPDDSAPTDEPEPSASAEEPEPTAEEPEPQAADDLTRIWGLGDSAAKRLQEHGIVTFSQLATLDEAQLVEIFGGYRMRMDTWPQQAQLAAEGDWQALDKLQNEF